jgi:hypothetical protein
MACWQTATISGTSTNVGIKWWFILSNKYNKMTKKNWVQMVVVVNCSPVIYQLPLGSLRSLACALPWLRARIQEANTCSAPKNEWTREYLSTVYGQMVRLPDVRYGKIVQELPNLGCFLLVSSFNYYIIRWGRFEVVGKMLRQDWQ